jgi:hypothetical protein
MEASGQLKAPGIHKQELLWAPDTPWTLCRRQKKNNVVPGDIRTPDHSAHILVTTQTTSSQQLYTVGLRSKLWYKLSFGPRKIASRKSTKITLLAVLHISIPIDLSLLKYDALSLGILLPIVTFIFKGYELFNIENGVQLPEQITQRRSFELKEIGMLNYALKGPPNSFLL